MSASIQPPRGQADHARHAAYGAQTAQAALPEHVDFLIVGAGISGLGAAHYLRERLPARSLLILDAMESFGGTWWTHRYPGARSDSDFFTYSYGFKPWRGRSIALAGEIRQYLAEVIDEDDLASRIRYGHKVVRADWSSPDKCWTVRVERQGPDGKSEALTLRADFLWMCSGYYQHDTPYTPEWPGFDAFKGTVVHPQHWPEDLDYTDKRIVLIGSGATAATLIPALTERAAHVTMLQRSPTFFYALPWSHELEAPLRALQVPDEWVHEILRRAHLARNAETVRMSFEQPEEVRKFLIDAVRALLPEGFDVEKHFAPRYRPWQQRLAVVPDGDMFKAVNSGKAGIVTDTIDHFDETGIVVSSGEHLDADIIITATGFHLQLFGGAAFAVDGEPVDFTRRVAYRGALIEGVPNLATVQGYFRSSWTLRVDLMCDFVCRVLQYMDARGLSVVTPTLRPEDADMKRLPWVDPEVFNAGYIMRSQHVMYGQGDRAPWKHQYEYHEERHILPNAQPDDSALVYR